MSSEAIPVSVAEQWRDKKRYLWLAGLVPPTAMYLAIGLIVAFNALGWHVVAAIAWWIGPILVYVVLPSVDRFFAPDVQNPPEEVFEKLDSDKYYRVLVWCYVPFQLGSVVLACYFFTARHLSWLGYDHGLGWPEKIGLIFSIGAVGGIAIAAAHEMGHKKDNFERWLAKITLAQTFYGHFYLEHNRGHHVRVATPEDPATARFGESFWKFLPRSVFGGMRSGWKLEAERLRRAGHSPWHYSNDVLNAWVLSIVLWGVLAAVFGWPVLILALAQGIYGFSLLETTNYLEHYGLLRQKLPNGRFERCTPQHSWNSDYIATNIFLFHLQRHSDHHANPTRRYQLLRSFDYAPSLPAGYAGMITLAYFPPLWRKVMDHRVLDHYNGDITKVNLDPAKAHKLLARYGATAQADGGKAVA